MSIELLRQKIVEHKIHGLYYFSLLNNLDSILENGILSKNDVERRGINFDIFANQEVQNKRHWKKFNLRSNIENSNPIYTHLHSLVPLYFTPKTPTLSAVRYIQNNIFFIQINPEIICNADISYCFTDGNAASNNTHSYTDLNDLDKLYWNIIHRPYWNNFIDGSRIRNSEVLVHPYVKPEYFNKIVVLNVSNQDLVNEKLKQNKISVECEVNLNYFF